MRIGPPALRLAFFVGAISLAPTGAVAADFVVDTIAATTAFGHTQCLTGTIEGVFGQEGTPLTEAAARAGDGDLSLPEAICLANVDDDADTIVLFDDTFVLSAIDNHWYGPNGLPPVFTPITIEGNGARIVREGDVALRFFYVAGPFHNLRAGKPAAATPGTLVLRNLTLAGGLFRGGRSENGGGGAGMGGAIFNQGTLTLDGVTAHDNRAEGGSAVGFGSRVNARIGGGGLGGDGGEAGGGFGGPGGHMGGETGRGGQAGTSRFGGNGAWGRDGGHGGGFVADGAQAPGDGGGGSGPAKDLTGGGGAFGG
ncbi:MAG: hypothetical protein IT385_10675, partial [Deltaproteobacteria bacterium]|nr:hypothetical protein [Deltaproteobacteria bacterium]